MEQVLVMTRLSWVVPRVVILVVCCAGLFLQGWFAPRILKSGNCTLLVKGIFVIGIVLYFAIALYAALSL